jgi:hypothetical protein
VTLGALIAVTNIQDVEYHICIPTFWKNSIPEGSELHIFIVFEKDKNKVCEMHCALDFRTVH